MMYSEQAILQFQETLWGFYRRHQRQLPWREPELDGRFDPYKIIVSEIMLQQTQVGRVIPKYQEFLNLFPTIDALAKAPLSAVLVAWSGLGYNRRAKYLHLAAKQIVANHGSKVPDELDALVKMPGIGLNTAGAVLAYAFNKPTIYIETNIRTVYIHHFFPGVEKVSDNEILELIKLTFPHEGKEPPETLTRPTPRAMKNGVATKSQDIEGQRKTVGMSHSREFYWALMDYGSHLKLTVGNATRRSKHYTKQSKFDGSLRQIRGQVLRLLASNPCALDELALSINDYRLRQVLESLLAENLIHKQENIFSLSSGS